MAEKGSTCIVCYHDSEQQNHPIIYSVCRGCLEGIWSQPPLRTGSTLQLCWHAQGLGQLSWPTYLRMKTPQCLRTPVSVIHMYICTVNTICSGVNAISMEIFLKTIQRSEIKLTALMVQPWKSL